MSLADTPGPGGVASAVPQTERVVPVTIAPTRTERSAVRMRGASLDMGGRSSTAVNIEPREGGWGRNGSIRRGRGPVGPIPCRLVRACTLDLENCRFGNT